MIDIGHGVTIEPRAFEGVVLGIAYVHLAPDGARHEGWVPFNVAGETQGWDVLSFDPLTIAPSLLCRACGHHGLVRLGKWVPA